MTDDSSHTQKGQPSLAEAALFGCCPQCGARTLFDAPLEVAAHCKACGLDFSKLERGARLAGVLTLLIAAILIGLAWWVDEAMRPPLWVHAIIWIPLTIGAVLGGVRFLKTVLLYARFDQLCQKGETKNASSSAAVGDKK